MSDSDLWKAAWDEITKTTDPYPLWVKKGKPATSHFAKAKALGDQIGVTTPVPPGPPPTPTPSGSMSSSQFLAAAKSGAKISDMVVTGGATIINSNVGLKNVIFEGSIDIEPSADNFSWVGGRATSFYLWGAHNALFQTVAFDGQLKTSDCKLWGKDGKLPSVKVLGCSFKHFSNDGDPADHNQAIFIGSSESVIVDGCTFDDNGNTAHLFVCAFGAIMAVPKLVVIQNNTFGPTHPHPTTGPAYFSINVKAPGDADSIPSGSNVYIQPGQPTVKPLTNRPEFVRNYP